MRSWLARISFLVILPALCAIQSLAWWIPVVAPWRSGWDARWECKLSRLTLSCQWRVEVRNSNYQLVNRAYTFSTIYWSISFFEDKSNKPMFHCWHLHLLKSQLSSLQLTNNFIKVEQLFICFSLLLFLHSRSLGSQKPMSAAWVRKCQFIASPHTNKQVLTLTPTNNLEQPITQIWPLLDCGMQLQ